MAGSRCNARGLSSRAMLATRSEVQNQYQNATVCRTVSHVAPMRKVFFRIAGSAAGARNPKPRPDLTTLKQLAVQPDSTELQTLNLPWPNRFKSRIL